MTESTQPTIIEVAVPLYLDRTYTYLVPDPLRGAVRAGMRVLVPFGRRTLTGYVLGRGEANGGELKEILQVLDREPLVTAAELEFLRWTAAYYHHPLGEVLKAALPSGINVTGRKRVVTSEDGSQVAGEVLTGGRNVRTETFYAADPAAEAPTGMRKGREIVALLHARGELPATELRRQCGATSQQLKRLVKLGLIRCEEREVYRDPFREEVFERDEPLALNPDQAAALASITAAVDARHFAPFLLFGVTGSGKTEVYLQAISHALEKGRRALVLVPEIALTPQLVRRFKRRFARGIAVLHSALSDGERYDEWRRIRRGEAEIVIGARSAIFAPLERLGVIVVDEEHEASYKQGEGFRYNARDLALVRGKQSRACVVLGSATPQVVTWHAAQEGRLTLLSLPDRVRGLPMPVTEIEDMRHRKKETFSPQLRTFMTENLTAGGQTILFLNRRGFATWLVCGDCGQVLRCPNCAVTLTFHQGRRRHICHYCDYSIPAPSVCPACDSPEIDLLGRGTERLEEEVGELFPEARVARLDRDTTSGRGDHARVLKGVEKGEIDILVGTQMIAKGHDFPGVTLVGVVSADASLNLPDFRSAERTFQLVSQVMGRAGRGDQPGRVVIQTLAPEHYAVVRAATHDYEGFCAEELAFRKELGYPPFAHLVGLTLSGTNGPAVEQGAEETAALLHTLKREARSRTEILGPAPAPLNKVRGRFRWQILLKCGNRTDLHRLVAMLEKRSALPAVVRLVIDIDPVDML
jgi:primosomal protein N' (replication factor Y) (superfamily II helicase)